MDENKADVLAHMAFPAQNRTKLHRANPLEHLNREVKRRADAVGPWHSFGPCMDGSRGARVFRVMLA